MTGARIVSRSIQNLHRLGCLHHGNHDLLQGLDRHQNLGGNNGRRRKTNPKGLLRLKDLAGGAVGNVAIVEARRVYVNHGAVQVVRDRRLEVKAAWARLRVLVRHCRDA